MIQQNSNTGAERDLDEAAHQQLTEEQNKALTTPTEDDIVEEEHDLDEASHQQLEDGEDH